MNSIILQRKFKLQVVLIIMVDYILYYYTPSLPAAIIFAVLFTLALMLLIYQTMHYRKIASKNFNIPTGKSFGCYIPLVIGTAMEAAGYVARGVSSQNKEKLSPFVVQSVLLLVSPAFMAASIYMLFHKILFNLRCQHISIVPPKFATSIYVIGDVLSFFVQAAGAGMMSRGTDNYRSGSNIVLGGLVIQLCFFGLFIITEFKFLFAVAGESPVVSIISKRWRYLNYALILSSLLILIRSIVRVVEFAEGHGGSIERHEYFLYIFDASMIFVSILVFVLTFPWANIYVIVTECSHAHILCPPFIGADEYEKNCTYMAKEST